MREANDVGACGEMNNVSCPAITEVSFQSRRTSAVRKRTRPEFTPLEVAGNPPPKSKLTFPLERAPKTSGPKTSKPRIDCRSVPPTEPGESIGSGLRIQVGTSWLSG